MNLKNRLKTAAAVAAAVAMTMPGIGVNAANTVSHNKNKTVADGVLTTYLDGATTAADLANGYQTYSNTTDKDSTNYKWNPEANTGEAGGAGQVQVVYDTTDGTWIAPGDSTTATDDNINYKNGTYQVTIPKKIDYEHMPIGPVNESVTYDVTVRGAIPTGKNVTLSAAADANLKTAKDQSVTLSVAQGKTTWSADECYGGGSATDASAFNADGSLKGTTNSDTVTLAGIAREAGHYTGVVTYTASLK